jgi:protein-S-isoprenylcysteine O-methyltransferase Ste14
VLVLPAAVVVYVPWWLTRFRPGEPFLGWTGFRWIGAALIALGLPVLFESWVRFVRRGLGTPAPILPPQRLVFTGFYRYVRNPMYVAVVAAVIGEALLLGSRIMMIQSAIVALCCHLFVVLYEEPILRRRFGAEYEDYCRRVPRWLPRRP